MSELEKSGQDADATFWYGSVGAAVNSCPGTLPPKVVSSDKKHWVEIAMVDEEGNPTPGQEYEITLPDGSLVTGTLDERGVARIEGIDAGNCQLKFPGLDKSACKKK